MATNKPAWKILLVLPALSLACAAQDTQPSTGVKVLTGTVAGSVYCSDTNLPARRARVSLELESTDASGQEGWNGRNNFTDLDGRFAVANVPEGRYIVSVEFTGYMEYSADQLNSVAVRLSSEARKELESHFTEVTVVANQTSNVTIRAERGTEIDGNVVYDDGSPAVDLRYSFEAKFGREEPLSTGPTFFSSPEDGYGGTTDDHGHFRIRGVTPGVYNVEIAVPTTTFSEERISDRISQISQTFERYEGALHVYEDGSFQRSKSKGFEVKLGDREKDFNITIPLSSLRTISGQVVLKSTGQQPAAASLQLLFPDTRELARAGIARDGYFEFHDVPEGRFILRAAANSLPMENIRPLPIAGPDVIHQGRPNAVAGADTAGSFAETTIIVGGNLNDLIIAVPDPPGIQ